MILKTILIVYKSKTGFTKKYSEWISEALKCQALPLEAANISEVSKYDIVIFGGGIYASKINGIKFITNNLATLKNTHLIVFATGATPLTAVEKVNQFKQTNIPGESNIPFFYFQSGMNYKNMGMIDKFIMNVLKFTLRRKKNKDNIEIGAMEAISDSYDNSNLKAIDPLINYVHDIKS